MNGRGVEGAGLESTQEVVKAAGVTSRTLRHYDEVGLLTPAATGPGGIRLYDQQNLLRLQQILLLRELDLPLPEIKTVLDGQRDPLAALREHRERLAQASARLDRLQQTIDATIANLERNRNMSAAEIFDGFDAEQQQKYEADLVERFGPQVADHIDESWRQVAQLSKDDSQGITQAYDEIDRAMTALLKAGANPGDEAVQQLIATHYALVCKFWTPNAQAYVGLGDLYLTHPDFKARYDAHDPGLAQFLQAAMQVYADAQLT